jgi:hypothetical protein
VEPASGEPATDGMDGFDLGPHRNVFCWLHTLSRELPYYDKVLAGVTL